MKFGKKFRQVLTITAVSALLITTAVAASTATKKMIEAIVLDPEIGDLFYGKVTRIMNFGAFVEFAPGKEGLIHISKLENHRVGKVEDVLNIGDETWVKVVEIDDKGRINLSRKDALNEIAEKEKNN